MKNVKKAGQVSGRNGTGGFTLIEVMLVVVIIGILATVAVIAVKGRSKQAAIAATRATIASIESAAKLYEVDCGDYPNSLDDLISNPGNTSWHGPYFDKPLKDGWGRALTYSKNDDKITVVSSGPDGSPGSGDDITN